LKQARRQDTKKALWAFGSENVEVAVRRFRDSICLYLQRLMSLLIGYTAYNDWIAVNNELEGMWKEAVWPNLR
jgi:hypothetical protein